MRKAELKIEIDADLLSQAEDAGLHMAGIAEEAIRRALRNTPKGTAEADEHAQQWAAENVDAIKAYNERIRRHGVFGDDLRTW